MRHLTFPPRRGTHRTGMQRKGMLSDKHTTPAELGDDVTGLLNDSRRNANSTAHDLGNSALAAGAQTKLKVSQPNDPLEQQADKVAASIIGNQPITALPERTATNAVQRMCKECEEEVLRKEKSGSTNHSIINNSAPNNVGANHSTTGSNQLPLGPGAPLPPVQQRFFEQKLGADLSAVRIHTGNQAAQMSESLQARAFTLGDAIAFNNNQFQPNSTAGRYLLAHELTHVLQQRRQHSHHTAYRDLLDDAITDGNADEPSLVEVQDEHDAEPMDGGGCGSIPITGDFGNFSPQREFTLPSNCRRIRLRITAQYYTTMTGCEACPNHLLFVIDGTEHRLRISTHGHSRAGFCGDGVEGEAPTVIDRTFNIGAGRHTRQFRKPSSGSESCRFWVSGSMSML